MPAGKTVAINEQALASDINSMSSWGVFAARPATGDVLAGSFYYSTDTNVLYQEQNGTWIAVLSIKTLNPANETVAAGYYAATTLSAVDAQLAAVNILSGVNIFGFVGVATVRDIADADAVVTDVKNGKTFYSITGARKTGTLATRTLNPANETVQAGYYAATTLSTVDGDLAVGNIKEGVTIFGKLGTLAPTLTLIGSGIVDVGKDGGAVTTLNVEVPAAVKKVAIIAGHAIEYANRGTTRGYYNDVEKFSFACNLNDLEEVVGQWTGDGLGFAADVETTTDTIDTTNRSFGYCWGVTL